MCEVGPYEHQTPDQSTQAPLHHFTTPPTSLPCLIRFRPRTVEPEAQGDRRAPNQLQQRRGEHGRRYEEAQVVRGKGPAGEGVQQQAVGGRIDAQPKPGQEGGLCCARRLRSCRGAAAIGPRDLLGRLFYALRFLAPPRPRTAASRRTISLFCVGLAWLARCVLPSRRTIPSKCR